MRILARVCIASAVFWLLSALSSSAIAQNLVPNSSFEKNIAIPTRIGCWYLSEDWNNVNMVKSTQAGSPDYFHADSESNMAPPNTQFGIVEPHSGKAMMGFLLYQFAPEDYREYISVELKQTLEVGKTYELSFWCTTGINNNKNQTYGAFNGLSTVLSTAPLNQSDYSPIHATPHYQAKSGMCDSTWQKLSFTFVADSSYKHITIGVFDKEEAFSPIAIANATAKGIYYFIDDVILRKRRPEKGRIG